MISLAPSFVSSRPPAGDAWKAPQLQRFEFKYLVNERVAQAMRPFVRCQLRPDCFGTLATDHSYAVHSLYLDSPDLALYGATQNGDRNRFKLRVRYYDDDAAAPAFFEVKRRRNDCISKLRATVHRAAVPGLIAGEWPKISHLLKPDTKQLLALQEFNRLARLTNATPRSHVAYRREAWVSPTDNSMRVTFDRQVQCEPQFSAGLHTSVMETAAVNPFRSDVIFELKFTDRLPAWCGELVRGFQLVRGGAAKYAEGVALLGAHRVSNEGVGLMPARATEDYVPEGIERHDTVNAV